jgi:hypothetical protein
METVYAATATTTTGALAGAPGRTTPVITNPTAPAGPGGNNGGPPPPPAPVAAAVVPLPKNYREYYTLRRDLDPPLEGVMDRFQAVLPQLNPNSAVRTYDELNDEILDTKDLNHHGCHDSENR